MGMEPSRKRKDVTVSVTGAAFASVGSVKAKGTKAVYFPPLLGTKKIDNKRL